MFAVIMAGGKGSRFWPRSRNRLPKHLLDIYGDRTLIQETVERVLPLVGRENILVITSIQHAEELRKQLPKIPETNIFVEPLGRNTAPCIGVAALMVKRLTEDDVMIVLPSDHIVKNVHEFRRVVEVAAKMATQGDYLITIGITPTGPETGYGYIKMGTVMTIIDDEPIFSVEAMIEKPSIERARVLIKEGGYYWNSGMFVWRVSTIMRAIERYLPRLYEGLAHLERNRKAWKDIEILTEVYRRFPNISIDYGVMEKAENILLLRGNFGWSDVGSWDALYQISERDENGIVTRDVKKLIAINARNCYAYSPQKLVSFVDVEDLIVVDTDDALLVCRRGFSQDVRKVVETLELEGESDFL
ncbi:MAG: sugar phosphate nucleotidyltransferase [Syntrophales bacterium]|nr:sugar phosphate nucleotidyltransferase [Syntrophales bacterium]